MITMNPITPPLVWTVEVGMIKSKAKEIEHEIISACNKYGLWCTVEYDRKPDLKMIRIKEISIKITDN